MSNWAQQAYDFFVSRGWSSAQAAGIVGNLQYESGNRWHNSNVGDSGTAFGMAQWRGERLTVFERLFGRRLQGSSFEQQLQYVDWELRNTESRAGRMLARATSVEDATRIFMSAYERPANMSSLRDRVAAAQSAIGVNNGEGGFTWRDIFGPIAGGRSPIEILGDELPDLTEYDPTGISGFLRDLFSGAMAARFVAVIVGIILIAVALIAFILMSDTGKAAVKSAAKAAV